MEENPPSVGTREGNRILRYRKQKSEEGKASVPDAGSVAALHNGLWDPKSQASSSHRASVLRGDDLLAAWHVSETPAVGL